MTVKDVLRECHARGILHIDVWLYSFGGLTHFGAWRVGQRTLYRDYDWGDGVGGPTSKSWGEWFAESDRVNGYRHNRTIVQWKPITLVNLANA